VQRRRKVTRVGDYLDESLRKIAKGAGIGFIGTFLGLALGYLSRMIIARWLGSADYGLINIGFAVMTIGATLSLLGLPSGIARFVSFYKGRGDRGRIKGTIISALKISIPISLIITLFIFLFADWISANVFHEPRLTPVLRIFSVGIPFLVLSSNFIAVTIGFQDLRYRVFVNDLFQNIFKLITILVLLLLGFGVLGATLGWVLAVILMPILAFYFLRKVFPFNEIKAIPVERELLSFSLPLIFAGLAGLIASWTDTLMLGYFMTASDVGIYNAALPTARLLSVFLGSFGTIFMPVASELYSRNAMEDLRIAYSVVTKWIFSFILPLFLLMTLFPGWMLEIMFGSEYVVAAKTLSILAFGYLIISTIGPTTHVLQAYGKTKIIMACSFFGAGMNFALNYFLIPLYGVTGAAIATSTSIGLASVLQSLFLYRIGKVQPFRRSFIKPFFASIISLLIVYSITKTIVGTSLLSLIIMFFIFLLLYFSLLLLFKSFDNEDLIIMMAIAQRLETKSEKVRRVIQKFCEFLSGK